jgi:glycerol-3-phosphate acyltransferase PlsY
MIAGISFPVVLNVILKNDNPILLAFSIVVAVLLLITHRKNIGTLVPGVLSSVFPAAHAEAWRTAPLNPFFYNN